MCTDELRPSMIHASRMLIDRLLLVLIFFASAGSLYAAAESSLPSGSCDLHQYASAPPPNPPLDFDSLISACHSSPPPTCLAASLASVSSSNKRLRSAASSIIRRITSTLPCSAPPSSADAPYLSNRYHVLGPFPAGKNEVDGTASMQSTRQARSHFIY